MHEAVSAVGLFQSRYVEGFHLSVFLSSWKFLQVKKQFGVEKTVSTHSMGLEMIQVADEPGHHSTF